MKHPYRRVDTKEDENVTLNSLQGFKRCRNKFGMTILRGIFRLTSIFVSALTSIFLLSGCGQTGSNETAPVSISFKIPSANHKVLRAPAPPGITSITLDVTASDMALITRSLSVTAGTLVTIDLEIPAGLSREFIAKAFDAGGNLLYQGSTIVDLVAGVPSTVQINMAALSHSLTITKSGTGTGAVTSSPAGISCGAACSASFTSGASVTLTATADTGSTFAGWSGACTGTGTCTVTMDAAKSVTAAFNLQTFKLTILGGGRTGAGPLPGIRVLRHDTTTGAVVGDISTDANGVADFGDIGAARTTISIVTTRTFACVQGTCTDKGIFTLVNIPAGTLTDNERFSVNHPARSTFSVNLTVPANTTFAELITGNSGQENFGTGSIAGPQASFTNVTIDRLQSDLAFSLLAEARDVNNAITGCGFLADLDPVAVNNTTVFFAASSTPVSIPFTASEPVFDLFSNILRKGVAFDNDVVPGGLQVPVASGTFNLCGVPLAEGFDIAVSTPQTTTASSKGIDMILSAMPVSLNFVLPSLSIDSLLRSLDGKTISFTRSGADLFKIDLAFVDHAWRVGSTDYEWFLTGDPGLTSFTLPQLPADLLDRIPPLTGVGFGASILGLDSTNGYDDFLQKYSAAGGDFEDNLIFTATELVWAGRSNPIISVTKTGLGTGTVTSNPPGINCGASCTAEFPGGTTVILTATPLSPSTFGGWSGECFGQRVSGNTCTLPLSGDDQDINVNAQFN